MTATQAIQTQDAARQMAFSSMTINDNSLNGTASENSLYSGKGANTITVTKAPVIKMAFSFTYDPVQVMSTIALGANINIVTYSSDDKGNHSTTKGVTGVGTGATTDPHLAKMVGVAKQPATNPGEAYIKVEKTAYGFKISYTRQQYLRESNTTITETLNADIGGPEQQYEAVLKPMPESKYETWFPKGPKVDGSGDTKGDDSAKFYVEVHDKSNPNKLYPGNFTVRYELKDITHYNGFNSNYPVYGAHSEADFKICDSVKYHSPNTFDPTLCTDSVATSVLNNGNLAIVQLTCMDYGAWAKLTAQVTLDDGSVLTASPYYDKGETFITIPFDRDENKIADAWEKSENILGRGYDLNWDDDVKPDNGHPGDNLPLIDEYRGFLTEDGSYSPVYTRFSPQKKELITIGVADEGALNAQYKQAVKTGTSNYSSASQIKVYHLTKSQYGKHEQGEPANLAHGRWINYNSPLKVYARGVIIVVNPGAHPTDADAQASTDPVPGAAHANIGALLPEETQAINVWFQNITGSAYKPNEYLPLNGHPDDADVVRKIGYIQQANAQFNVNIDPYHASDLVSQYLEKNYGRIIAYSVGHELGHATNIHHHHLSEGEAGFFKGNVTCPMRYWMSNKIGENSATWVAMYITGNWNPETFTTPGTSGGPMMFCTGDDNCFSQLQLKK